MNKNSDKKGTRKVALVRGPLVSTRRALNNETTPAIGLAYLSGYLRAREYETTIVDAIAEGLNEVWLMEEFPGYIGHGLTLDETVERVPPDIGAIGISCMFSGEWPVQCLLIKRLRAAFPEALIVAGGEHITALSEYVLRDCPELDLCVRGEGEHTFYEVLEQYFGGEDCRAVNGVSYLEADGIYREAGELPRVRDLSTVPWPDWPAGYLEKFWEAGKSYGVQTGRDMPINVSRGCPYRCTFCSSPQMWTTRYVLRDIDDVVAEIRHYMERYDIDSLQFYDLTAITKKRWTIAFCKRLLEEGIRLKWSLPSGTRSEALDEETLGLLKETGCSYLVYAPESAHPRTLERIKKRVSIKNLTKSVLCAQRLGIVVRINLIIGFPGESRWEAFRTILYGLKMAIRGADEVPINLYSAYPGSELFRQVLKEKKIELNDQYFLSLTSLNGDYTMFNPMTMNEYMGARELAIFRLTAMLLNYGIQYLIHPTRIVRTIRNVFGGEGKTATVFEHRLKDARRRNLRPDDLQVPSHRAGEA